MPIYTYACARGHRMEQFRKMRQRNHRFQCPTCHLETWLIMSPAHIEPDGLYSYAPNIGSPEAFERRQAAIRERREGGRGIIPKQDQPTPRD